ncbi:MAG: PqqD family protein [Dehalococcoidia bacterium]|nr:PqqD family protein [Dehalococcoidia bacterium]MDD5493188.1 PqqD family protein [Dehalococcoidia bacterium]
MLELRPDTILTLAPQIVLHSIPDQEWYFAFNITTGDQFRLNRTSYWVLEQINGGVEYSTLMRSVLNIFEVPENQGSQDLKQLINKLIRQKIIRRQADAKKEDTVSKTRRRKAK